MGEPQPGPYLQRLLQWATRFCRMLCAQLALQQNPIRVEEPAPEEPVQEERMPQLPPAVVQLRELFGQPLVRLNQARVWTNRQHPDDSETIHSFLTLRQ